MGNAAAPAKTALVVGWNGAGKTAIVQRIQGRSSEPLPTTGVLRESCSLKLGPEGSTQMECQLELVDVGSMPKVEAKKAAYGPFLAQADGVIIVIDATKTCLRFRADEVTKTKEFIAHISREPEVRDKPFLVLANKCDREDALSTQEILETFDLEGLFRGKQFQLQRCSAVTAEGLKAGVAWLTSKLVDQNKEGNEGNKISSTGFGPGTTYK
eukprot:gnl/TRDRNA2_/TRDRNA2_183795_c0_seq1.p1 gnl/TRDRNA2_/TRDRNA2_183795_c0~~gnl/TRDRNA2_/TRDRNA2_183795_c0_seq1.p1  ORF type:complete len:227 (+),score=49.96 gnl/TRDRNA2_/TRDRNA2_183795_c0_seq1:47-682(+)